MAKVIDLRKIYVWELLEDTEAGLKYGKPKRLAKAIKAELKPKTVEAKLYADGALDEAYSAVTSYDLSFEINELSLEDQAWLLGSKVNDKGMIEMSSETEAPYFAIAFETPMTSGKVQYVNILKAQFMPLDESYETRGENVNFQTPKITAVGAVSNFTSTFGYKVIGDEANKDVVNAWYSIPQLMEGQATVDQSKEPKPKKKAPKTTVGA